MVPKFLKFAHDRGWLVSSLQGLISKNYIVGHLDGNHGNLYPKQDEFVESGIKYISANAIVGGRNDFQKSKYLSQERANEFKKGVAKNGDVIFAHNATVGPVAVLETDDDKVILSTSLTYYRVNNEKLDALYLSQYMSSSAFIRQYESIMRQTTRNQIPITAQREFLFAVPSLPEQKKIAKILSTWDKAITTTEQLLANSQQQKKALMQQLLIGRKRLLDKDGVRFSGVWHRSELGSLLDYKQPTPYLVSSTAYNDAYPTPVLTAGKTFILGYTNEDFGIYQEQLPAIIFDDFTTDSKFVDFPFKAKSSAMKILSPRKGVSIKYIYEAMQMLNFKVGGHQRHWISIFSNLVIPVPEYEEQERIASVLSAADQEVAALEHKLSLLQHEKKALMQQLLTGKRRTKVE